MKGYQMHNLNNISSRLAAGLLFEPDCLPPELHSHSSPTMSQFLSEQWEFEYQTRKSRRYMFRFPYFWSLSHGSEWWKFYCLDYKTKELFFVGVWELAPCSGKTHPFRKYKMKEDTKPKTPQNCPLTSLTPQKETSDDWLTFKGGGWLQHFLVALTPSALSAVLVPYHCCNKLTQTWERKQNRYYFTLLGSEVQHRSYWAKVKVSTGLSSFWRLQGRVYFLAICSF